jgi:8-hydroxy-5-deazaflavin:NADPH oxidoreductase
MRIAVIGTGKVGGTLGRAWARAGHVVTFGSRRPAEDDVPGDTGANVASIGDALSATDVVLLAIPGQTVSALLAEHPGSLDGRLVIDATNNAGAGAVNASAQVATAAPSARYVRAFNMLGWENFANPRFGGVAADLFFSAPTSEQATVERLISDVGLRPAYLGENQHEVLDGVLPLWFDLVRARGGNRRLAFRVLTD